MFSKHVVLFSTFSQKEICNYLELVIDKRHKNFEHRSEILKAAMHLEFDPNYDKFRISFFHYAIIKSDYLTVGKLLEYNVDINKKNEIDEMALHVCAKTGNKYLLTSLLNKTSEINSQNCMGETPLMITCIKDDIDCMDILLKRGANVKIRNDDGKTIFMIIINKMTNVIEDKGKSYSVRCKQLDVYIKMYKLIIAVKKRINTADINSIQQVCFSNLLDEMSKSNNDQIDYNLEILKIAIDKDPNIANRSYDPKTGNTLLHLAIILNKTKIIDYLCTIDDFNWSVRNINKMSYLHMACKMGNVTMVRLIVKLENHLADRLCRYAKSPMEYVLTSDGNSDDVIIGMIKALVEETEGDDDELDIINFKSNGLYPINHAIQFCSERVIEEMINLGANIYIERIGNKILYPGINNDIVGYASQLGKINVIKVLLGKGAIIHESIVRVKSVDGKEHIIKVPTPLVIALLFGKEETSLYLLTVDQIKSYLNDNSVKKYLLKISLDEGITNKSILLNFVSHAKYKTIHSKYKKTNFEIYEIIISRNIPIYKDNKYVVIYGVYYITLVLHGIFTHKSDTDIHKIFDTLDKLYDIISCNVGLIECLLSGIGAIIDYANITDIKNCIHVVREVYEYVNKLSTNKVHLANLKKNSLASKLPEIKKLLQMAKTVATKCPKPNDDIYDEEEDGEDVCTCVNCNIGYNECCQGIDHDSSDGAGSDVSKELCDCCRRNKNIETDSESEINDSYSEDFDESEKYDEEEEYCSFSESIDEQKEDKKIVIDKKTKIKKLSEKKVEIIEPPITFPPVLPIIKQKYTLTNYQNGSGHCPTVYGSGHCPTLYGSGHCPTLYGSGHCPTLYGSGCGHMKKIPITSKRTLFVTRALFKLCWPNKVEHYDKLYKLLTQNDATYNIMPENITVYNHNCSNTTSDFPDALIYPGNSLDRPSRWISYYAPNIGNVDKTDANHMFPFVLDIILKTWPCIEFTSLDINHIDGLNNLVYFYGHLRLNGKMEIGCFEYFINSYGTLFHRMFRPYVELPLRVKKQVDMIKTVSVL